MCVQSITFAGIITTHMNKYVQFLNTVTVEDPFRPWMETPFRYKDKIVATNAMVMVAMPVDMAGEMTFPNQDSIASKIDSVFSGYKPVSKLLPLEIMDKIESLCPLVDELNLIEEAERCKTCDGEGTVEWWFENFEKEDDCPVCHGQGETGEDRYEKTGKQIKDVHAVFTLFSTMFAYGVLKPLIELSRLMDSSAHLVGEISGRQLLFEVGDVQIVLCGVTYGDDIIYEYE